MYASQGYIGNMSNGATEALAAAHLLDKNDPTLLSYKEIKSSWGSCSNFMYSYGLKPWNMDDIEEAKAISRGFREMDIEREEEAKRQKKK